MHVRVWQNTSETLVAMIESVQKRALCLISLPAIPCKWAAFVNNIKQPSLITSLACCNKDLTQTILPDLIIPASTQVNGCTERNCRQFSVEFGIL